MTSIKIERIQFRAGPVAAQIADRTDADRAMSADLVAKRDLLRYYTLLANDLRTVDLTPNEAMLCCEALSGPLPDPDDVSRSPGSMLASLVDSMHLDRLDEKWEVDRSVLTEKVTRWTAGQRYAVTDAVERWWLLTNDYEIEDDEALVKVGLIRKANQTA